MDETKRIVIENFPIEKLPAEVREQFAAEERVVLTVEAGQRSHPRRTISAILDAMQNERVFSEDAVKRVRALRAEWDHRDELHDRIRRGEAI
jgi:hypothetical protein